MLGLLAVLATTAPALAQQDGVAESLFRRAREEMKRGEYASACPKFEESYRLDPSIGTLLNLALCEEALGHTATAWTKLREFLDSAPSGDSRVPVARDKLAKLEAELPWLHLTIDPTGAQTVVQLDDVELRAASLSQAIPVDPGEHVVRVTLSTGESLETPFRIHPKENLYLRATAPSQEHPALPPTASAPLVTLVEPQAPRAVASTLQSPTPTQPNTERAVAYGIGAVGIAGLVTSGVFGLMALHNRNVVREQCPNRECETQSALDAAESGARYEKIANVAFAVGAVGLVTGGVLLWHSGRTTAVASVSSNSAFLSVVGSVQ
jgi:hypothetical protein